MDIFDILLDILLKPPQPFIGLFFSPPPYAPYVHCLQDSDWLMSPPYPIRSMEMKNLININPDFFPHHLTPPMRPPCRILIG